MRKRPTETRPVLVYADASGSILDFPGLEAAGSSAGRWQQPQLAEWIPLPPGSELFLLPERLPVGYDRKRSQFRVLEKDPFSGRTVSAVAAFVAPAFTQLYSAVWVRSGPAPLLPLFAYTAVGWRDGEFVTAALRVDADPRQDFDRFDADEIARKAQARLAEAPGNRLLQHLGRCALTYGCPAARNLFLGRWEAPLPTSPACNARCLGCISLQEASGICATQERITFVPTPEEICSVAVPHLQNAPRAVVSFGQGCEGEPLLQADVLEDSIRRMRAVTARGTINLNTNASLPERILRLREAGLDSIRVSLNSCRPGYYESYYAPRGYGFAEVIASIKGIKETGGFASLNYFVLPGFTDEPEEFDCLSRFLEETQPDLIQMRNLNIDPEWYLSSIHYLPQGQPLGIRQLMERIRERFPGIRFGYYNPCLDPKA